MFSYKRNQIIMSVLLIIVVCFMLTGCGGMITNTKPETFTSVSYKSLSTAATFYDTTMKSVAELYKNKQITDADKDKVIELGNKFWESYHSAVSALEIYEKSTTPTDKIIAKSKVDEFEQNYNTFVMFVTPILNKYLTK